MATEYISRDAMHKANRCEWDGVCGDYDGHQIFIDNENMIDSIPAADVRPVVRGMWEWENTDALASFAWTCSACGQRKAFKTNFCPNCGADMRNAYNG